MKKTILMISCLLCMQVLFAQEENPKVRKNEFGINAGFTTGVGFSYRFWPKKIGFQITALPIKQNDRIWISAGITGLYKFYDAKYVRVFGYLGNHLLIYDKEYYIYNTYPYSSTQGKKRKELYNIGFGPGFGFGKVVKFNIMFGYSAQDVLEDFNLLPTGEIGLYYAF